ncbi:MAG TPA: ATP-binding protein [Oculatellaceae cyanobacterium]
MAPDFLGSNMGDDQQLNNQIDQLARSNDDLSQFAYLAAHDLQEPLRAITGFLSLLKERHKAELSPEATDLLTEALSAADRMCLLTQALLTLSRVESQEIVFEMINSRHCVDDALSNLKTAIEAKDADIIIGDLPVIRGNPTLLTMVFQNLVGNSLKFCDSRPKIRIDATRAANEWIFSVQDNGVGFDMQYIEKLFHRFQRLHAKARYPGTGLGLALCKRIIDRHSGKIWARSDKNQGATFCFSLSAE